MVHETWLDTAAYSAVCPGRRLLVIANSFDEAALKNAVRNTAIPILDLADDRAATLLHFQRVRMLVTFRSEQQRASSYLNRHYPQSYHDLLFVRWKGGSMSVEEESPEDAGAGLYYDADQWRSLFERSALGAAVTELLGASFPYGKSRFSGDARLLKRRTTATLAPRHLCGWRRWTNIEFRYANCAKACVFSMSSKHSTVVRTELPFRSTRTFQRLAGGRRISKRFLHSQSTLRRARQPRLPLAHGSMELGRLARLTTVDAMAASIAHELNQPLASIVANRNAGLRW